MKWEIKCLENALTHLLKVYYNHKETKIHLQIAKICGILEELYNKENRNVATDHDITGTILPTGGNYMGRYLQASCK